MEDKKIKYDPSQLYTWTPQTVFELDGEQFGAILNTFRAILSTPEANALFQVSRTNQLIEKILADAIERGDVIEAPSPISSPQNIDRNDK